MIEPACLDLVGVEGGYGAAPVLHGVDLRIDPGEVVAVIGPNGAGKTTLLRTITGRVRPTAGAIRVDGHDVPAGDPRATAKLGIACIEEGGGIFPTLSVELNLRVALGVWSSGWRRPRLPEQAFDLLPWLRSRAEQRAGSLSGGERQQLALARAVLQRPRYLLLDEPTTGLSPLAAVVALDLVRSVASEHAIGVVLVEQRSRSLDAVADRQVRMDQGRLRRLDADPS